MPRYYLGQGKVYLSKRDPDLGTPVGGFRFLGNVPMLKISTNTQKVSHFESYTGQQLEDLAIETKKSASFMLSLEDFSMENLGIAFFGNYTTSAAGLSVSNEQQKGYKGKNILLNNINLQSFSGLLDSSNSPIAATHYQTDLKSGTVSILNTAPITDGDNVKASYVTDGMEQINAFTQDNEPYWIRFNGINLANNKPTIADLFKARFSPSKELELIQNGTEVAKLDLEGNVQYDELAPDGGFLRLRFGT